MILAGWEDRVIQDLVEEAHFRFETEIWFDYNKLGQVDHVLNHQFGFQPILAQSKTLPLEMNNKMQKPVEIYESSKNVLFKVMVIFFEKYFCNSIQKAIHVKIKSLDDGEIKKYVKKREENFLIKNYFSLGTLY